MSQDIAIRTCAADDSEALALVGQATFLESFAGILDGGDIIAHCANQHAAGVYREWLNDAACRVWLAETAVGRAPVGYLVLTPPKLSIADPRSDDLEIKRIYILHRFHGGGLGRRLMQEALHYAKSRNSRRLLLGVYSGNDSAIAFYEKLGYRRVGTRKFRVGHRDYDDLILALDL